MDKFNKWFDGKKTYFGAIGLLVGAGYYMTLMIMNNTESMIAWGLIDKVFEHVLIPFFVAVIGIGFRHGLKKQEVKIDHIKDCIDKEGHND